MNNTEPLESDHIRQQDETAEAPRRVYFNEMQRDVIGVGAHTTVITAGRGTGKGVAHAAVCLRNFQEMPGSTTAFVVPCAKRGLTNTLPSMFQHWESWGYRRGIHWDVGKKPNQKLGWGTPLIAPENWDSIITFYNGSIGQIVSQERRGTSNSKSFDFVDIDEAKYVDFEQLKDETFPANRGQVREFGHCPRHHGLLITSDMPVTTKGSWFLRYEHYHDDEAAATILELQQMAETLKPRAATDVAARRKLNEVENILVRLRRSLTFARRYSSITNLAVLGEAWVRQMKRDLPPLVFRTSILCLDPDFRRDGFYSSLSSDNIYRSSNVSAIDRLGFEDLSPLRSIGTDSRSDGDIDDEAPICVAFDYNNNINWLVCGQPREDLRRLNVLRAFYVKYERKLRELVYDFCTYYAHHRTKEVIFYYDHTALAGNYAVNDEDFAWVIQREFETNGWSVLPVYIGQAMKHREKYLLINRGLAGQARLRPMFNEEGTGDLLISIKSAGMVGGKKDKRGEKLAETEEDRLEYRTDGSDAFDTLYIGCERFPQDGGLLVCTSGSY